MYSLRKRKLTFVQVLIDLARQERDRPVSKELGKNEEENEYIVSEVTR